MNSRIDLVIPVYGEAPFLDQTIKSCLDSHSKSLNIIWVLDRPSTIVRRKIEKFSLMNTNSEVVCSNTPGIVAALNLGIERGTSEYIARLDSDDLMESNRLDVQSHYLDTKSEVGLVGSQMTLIGSNSEIFGVTRYPCEHSQIIRLLEFQNCIGHPSVMFRRNVFEKVGGYRPQFTGAEDYDLWLRMGNIAKLHNLATPLTRYRISEFQFTKRKESNQGLVETAVRLDSLGYRVATSEMNTTQPIELETSNKLIMKFLKENYHDAYRVQTAIASITKAYSLKSKGKRYTVGVCSIMIAFLRSPTKTISYLHVKFFGYMKGCE